MSADSPRDVAWSASPAAGRCMSGEPFLLEGRIAKVEERHPSNDGLQADGLFIRFVETCRPDQIGMLGTTVEAIERRIACGQVHFLEGAAAFNARYGWANSADGMDRKHPGHRDKHSRKRRCAVRARLADHVGPDGGVSDDPRSTVSAGAKSNRCGPFDRRIRTTLGRAATFSIVSSRSWTSIRQVCDRLWADWRPEWGRPPSDRTVRRWVQASCTRMPAAPNVCGPDERRGRK